MHACLDDLVTAPYVTIDDLLADRPRQGRPPRLSDAELVCLAAAQVLLGFAGERRWLRFARRRLGHLFPYLPQPPGYNKRLRGAHEPLRLAIRRLALSAPSWFDGLWPADSTPSPCAASRETVERSDLAGHAGCHYCPSHPRYFWGMRLYLVTAGDGMPILWGLADARLGVREVLADLLDRDQQLLRPDRRGERPRHGSLGRWRKWIESVFDTLKGQLSLEQHGGRTPTGVFVRVAQRILAMAAAIWLNRQLDQPNKRSLIAYDH